MTRPNPPTSSSRKPAQIQLQTDINNDQELINFTKKTGLLVIDVYAGWCGPCTAMTTTLKKLKVEIGGENLWFGVAKSDDISFLTLFRNRSEPTWLFVLDGKVLKIFFGASAPKLAKSIASELEKLVATDEGTASDPEYITVDKLASLEKEDLKMMTADERKEICLKLLRENIEVNDDHEEILIMENNRQGSHDIATKLDDSTQLNSLTNEFELSELNERMLQFTKSFLSAQKETEDDRKTDLEGVNTDEPNRVEGELKESEPSIVQGTFDHETKTELESKSMPQLDKFTSTIDHQIEDHLLEETPLIEIGDEGTEINSDDGIQTNKIDVC